MMYFKYLYWLKKGMDFERQGCLSHKTSIFKTIRNRFKSIMKKDKKIEEVSNEENTQSIKEGLALAYLLAARNDQEFNDICDMIKEQDMVDGYY